MNKLYDETKNVYEILGEVEFDKFVDWCIDKEIITDEIDSHNLDWDDYKLYVKDDFCFSKDKLDRTLKKQEVNVALADMFVERVDKSDCPFDFRTKAHTLAFSNKLVLEKLKHINNDAMDSNNNIKYLAYQLGKLEILISKCNIMGAKLTKKFEKCYK